MTRSRSIKTSLSQPTQPPAVAALTGLALIQELPISSITWITCEGCGKLGEQVFLKAQTSLS